jgi:hypothetical protein
VWNDVTVPGTPLDGDTVAAMSWGDVAAGIPGSRQAPSVTANTSGLARSLARTP